MKDDVLFTSEKSNSLQIDFPIQFGIKNIFLLFRK